MALKTITSAAQRRRQKPHVLPDEKLNAYHQLQERYRLLIEETRDYAIFMLDPSGHVTSWNIGAERIKGYKAEEIIGKHFGVFYTPEAVRAHRPEQMLSTALKNGRSE